MFFFVAVSLESINIKIEEDEYFNQVELGEVSEPASMTIKIGSPKSLTENKKNSPKKKKAKRANSVQIRSKTGKSSNNSNFVPEIPPSNINIPVIPPFEPLEFPSYASIPPVNPNQSTYMLSNPPQAQPVMMAHSLSYPQYDFSLPFSGSATPNKKPVLKTTPTKKSAFAGFRKLLPKPPNFKK